MADTTKGVSRKRLLGMGLAAAIAVATAVGAVLAQPAAVEELVFVNGSIHTMDAKNTVATTATIRGTVTDEGGAAISGAEITATSVTSGFTHTARARADDRCTM